MRPHPRIRKTVKWGGAVLCAALLLTWIGSNWFSLSCVGHRWATSITRGRIVLYHLQGEFAGSVRGWSIHSPQPLDTWSWIWDYQSRRAFYGVWLPLWIPAVLAAVPLCVAALKKLTALFRPPAHVCRSCRYDRTGLARSAVCPECGSPAPGVSPAPIQGG